MSLQQVHKILRVALDPSAGAEEAENAAKMAVRLARRSGLSFLDVFPEGFDGASLSHDPNQPPPACDVVMPYGKHKGMTLIQIAIQHPGYINWWLTNCDPRPGLTDAMQAVMAYVSHTGGQP